MALNTLAFADIVEEQNEIKEAGLSGLVEFVAIFFGAGARRGEKIIEFADGAEGMNISGVAVIIFMLDEAGQRFELASAG